MPLDPRAIATALANQIDANTSRALACYDLHPPTEPQYPCVVVQFAGIGYHETMGGAVAGNVLARLDLEVVVLAQGTSDLDGQIAVLDMLSSGSGKPNSIIDAIEVDRTLGGAVADAFVVSATGLSRQQQESGSGPIASTLTVTVRARR